MLARVPAGDLIDRIRHEPKLRAAEVLHSDTTWRPCTVLAWARHRGSWAVLIRWPDGHEDWREYDPRNIRPGRGPTLGTADPAAGNGQIATARVGPGLLRMWGPAHGAPPRVRAKLAWRGNACSVTRTAVERERRCLGRPEGRSAGRRKISASGGPGAHRDPPCSGRFRGAVHRGPVRRAAARGARDYAYQASIVALTDGHPLTLSTAQVTALANQLAQSAGPNRRIGPGSLGGSIAQWVQLPNGRWISEKDPGVWSFTDMRAFRLGGPGPHCNIGQPHSPVIGRPGKRAAAPGGR
jgi:hypothetical protein